MVLSIITNNYNTFFFILFNFSESSTDHQNDESKECSRCQHSLSLFWDDRHHIYNGLLCTQEFPIQVCPILFLIKFLRFGFEIFNYVCNFACYVPCLNIWIPFWNAFFLVLVLRVGTNTIHLANTFPLHHIPLEYVPSC